mmetsp:Transcript_109455/g.172577  ORF Transcript_109455/g.172577 Transcript_109455/m.172577 type:complete len:220 (+) Transcript_109455:203-862(+)
MWDRQWSIFVRWSICSFFCICSGLGLPFTKFDTMLQQNSPILYNLTFVFGTSGSFSGLELLLASGLASLRRRRLRSGLVACFFTGVRERSRRFRSSRGGDRPRTSRSPLRPCCCRTQSLYIPHCARGSPHGGIHWPPRAFHGPWPHIPVSGGSTLSSAKSAFKYCCFNISIPYNVLRAIIASSTSSKVMNAHVRAGTYRSPFTTLPNVSSNPSRSLRGT